MITLFDNRMNQILYTSLVFAGGEVYVNIVPEIVPINVAIYARLDNSNEVMKLFMLTDALRRRGATHITLTCPYLPYARQDRECAVGDAFGLKVFADMLNAQNYTAVKVMDTHSDVAKQLIRGLIPLQVSYIASAIFARIEDLDYIVCPDKGAKDRADMLLEYANSSLVNKGVKGILYFDEHRDPKTGSITSIAPAKNLGDIKGGRCLIVDDICDDGATFKSVAELLRVAGAATVDLFVTHGIFSKGLAATGCDRVLTTDSTEPKDDGREIVYRFNYFGGESKCRTI